MSNQVYNSISLSWLSSRALAKDIDSLVFTHKTKYRSLVVVCFLAFAQGIQDIASEGIISRSNPPNK